MFDIYKQKQFYELHLKVHRRKIQVKNVDKHCVVLHLPHYFFFFFKSSFQVFITPTVKLNVNSKLYFFKSQLQNYSVALIIKFIKLLSVRRYVKC